MQLFRHVPNWDKIVDSLMKDNRDEGPELGTREKNFMSLSGRTPTLSSVPNSLSLKIGRLPWATTPRIGPIFGVAGYT